MNAHPEMLESKSPPSPALTQPRELDRTWPEWARRSNPIVRRQLGIYWKLMPPDFDLLGRYVGWQLVLVLLSLPVPFLLTLFMPAATVSLVVLPVAFYLHVQSLFRVGAMTTASVLDEVRNDSLDLLRLCPRPLHEILFSKAAAGVWRSIEDISMVLFAASLTTLPLLIILYDNWVGTNEQPVLARLAICAALIVSVVRIPLECALMASFGALVGTTVKLRGAAIMTTALLGVGYVAAVNLIRLPPWPPGLRLLVELVPPIVFPLLLIPLCFSLAVRQIEHGK
jgi:hypothetical protein